jgi:hypothetical protein
MSLKKTPFVKFIYEHKWAWMMFKFLVLPALAVWGICKNRLPDVIAEYHSDVTQLDADIAIYRAGRNEDNV